jgi:long-subunit fatty acid transport protein
VDGLPSLNSYYMDVLGFNSLEYTEYFKTQGTGFNFKIGGVARLNEMVRVGLYYHTPTVYNLSDTYYNAMSASFDKDKSQNYTSRNPLEEDGDGFFEYKVITPSRFGVNSAFIIQKMAVIGLDYELVNYRKAQLSSDKLADFAGVNSVIKTKYSHGHNVRIGAELNVKPVMIRAGYVMQGSPFGDVFTGSFVRHTVSAGLGFRSGGQWYLDLVLAKTFSKEDYLPFTTLPTKATINYNATTFAATIGLKF